MWSVVSTLRKTGADPDALVKKECQKYHHLQMLGAIKADKTIPPQGSTTRLKSESARHKVQKVPLM